MTGGNGLVLVCDLDGVIFDFDRGWTERHRAQFLWSEAKPGLEQEWDELHTIGGFATRGEYWAWFQESGGFSGLPLYPGAREALWMADTRGWFIVYATNRPEWARQDTQDSLVHAGLPQVHHLNLVERKWDVPGDLYLEDAPANILAMMSMGCRVVPVSRSWNRKLTGDWDPEGLVPMVTRETLEPWLRAVETLGKAGVGTLG